MRSKESWRSYIFYSSTSTWVAEEIAEHFNLVVEAFQIILYNEVNLKCKSLHPTWTRNRSFISIKSIQITVSQVRMITAAHICCLEPACFTPNNHPVRIRTQLKARVTERHVESYDDPRWTRDRQFVVVGFGDVFLRPVQYINITNWFIIPLVVWCINDI